MKTALIAVGQNVFSGTNSDGTATTTTRSGASVRFLQFTQADPGTLTNDANLVPSLGTCYSAFSTLQGGYDTDPATYLNAGPSITLTPPSGNALNLLAQYTGSYGLPNTSTTLPSGTWSFSNGPGGPDVGPLSFTFPVPQPVTLTNQAPLAASPMIRAKPLTITWSGGDSDSYVEIEASTGVFGNYSVGLRCATRASAGQLTIPPSMLLAIPPDRQVSVQVSTVSFPFSLGTVPGLDAAVNQSRFTITVPSLIFK